MGQCYTTCC